MYLCHLLCTETVALAPAVAGALWRNPKGIEALIACAGDKLDLEATTSLNGATALQTACYSGSLSIVQPLIDAGAFVNRVNDNGSSVLMNA